jgi:FkbM family methyltransferase
MSVLKWFNGNIKKVISNKNPSKFLIVHSYKKIIRIISTVTPSFLDFFPVIYKKGAFRLRLAPTLLSYVMYEYENVRAEDENFIIQLLQEGDIYVDVGANVGNTTLAAATAVGKSGHVYSFEAHPRTYKYLLRSIHCNEGLISRITTKNVALGEKNGEVFFTDLQNDDINKVAKSGKVKVKLETLDEQDFKQNIDVLKIDVEGYEYFVLQGAKKTLQKTEVLIFESFIENYKTFNVKLEDIFSYLKSLGFSLYTVDGGNLSEITKNHLSLSCEDLIACKDISKLLRKGFTLNVE